MNFANVRDLVLKSAVDFAQSWPWLESKINHTAINGVVNVCRHRPHPWSTAHDYVSWVSLSDQRWSARHLPATHLENLPDPSTLVEMFRRPSGQQRLCPKSTLLFPAFAQYLTDGFIRTRMPKSDESPEVRRQNTSNHQIDMCPLYGRTDGQTDALRLKSEEMGKRGRVKSQLIRGEEFAPFLCDESGAIKKEFEVLDPPLGLTDPGEPDFSARDRELRQLIFAFGGDRANGAPQVALLNTLFLREHNRLAGEMERANPAWNDERVFQTARNTVIALFIKIVVEEYINHISPVPFRLRADPSVAWNAPWNKPNWITTEFSLLYRWHSLMPDTLTWNGVEHPIANIFLNNGPLLDAGLARSFSDLSSQRAGQLGAFNTADALLPIELKAIDQGRLVAVAPYTDYCNYVGHKRPRTFSEVSKDARVVAFLESNYDNVSDVEFYVGLFAEDITPNSPLPPLLRSLVAVDAFSQALTNPLLSKSVFHPETFSPIGWNTIQNTKALRDVVERNTADAVDTNSIGMTVKSWKLSWPWL